MKPPRNPSKDISFDAILIIVHLLPGCLCSAGSCRMRLRASVPDVVHEELSFETLCQIPTVFLKWRREDAGKRISDVQG